MDRMVKKFGRAGAQLVAITHWQKGAWAKHYRPEVRHCIIPNSDILKEYRARFERRMRSPPPPDSSPDPVESTFTAADTETQDEASGALIREISALKQQLTEERLIAILTCASLLNVIFSPS